jgi:hypothetical protein
MNEQLRTNECQWSTVIAAVMNRIWMNLNKVYKLEHYGARNVRLADVKQSTNSLPPMQEPFLPPTPPPPPLKGTVASDQVSGCTANEGLVRIQYKCLVPIYVFPEMKLLFPNRIIMFCLPVPTLINLWEIYIYPGSVCLFCCRKIYGPILGIYNHSQTRDKWMLKLGLRPRNSQKRNI